jgi:hypothetical protein
LHRILKGSSIKDKEKLIFEHNKRVLERFPVLSQDLINSTELMLPSNLAIDDLTSELESWAKLELVL